MVSNVKGTILPRTVRRLSFFASLAVVLSLTGSAHAQQLINGGFEDPPFSPGISSVDFPLEGQIPGWQTTATDNAFEIWSDGFNGVTSFEGTQHAELNAFQVSTLFQDVAGISAGTLIGFEFAHRGRAGLDTLRLTITDLGIDSAIGGGDDTVLFTDVFSTDETAWAFYTGDVTTLPLGNTVRFAYESVSAAGGPTVGNFLDAARFGVGVGPSAAAPEPASLVLAGLGALGLGAGFARRRK